MLPSAYEAASNDESFENAQPKTSCSVSWTTYLWVICEKVICLAGRVEGANLAGEIVIGY